METQEVVELAEVAVNEKRLRGKQKERHNLRRRDATLFHSKSDKFGRRR